MEPITLIMVILRIIVWVRPHRPKQQRAIAVEEWCKDEPEKYLQFSTF